MNLKMNVDNFCIFFWVQGIGLQAKYLFLLKLTPFFGTTIQDFYLSHRSMYFKCAHFGKKISKSYHHNHFSLQKVIDRRDTQMQQPSTSDIWFNQEHFHQKQWQKVHLQGSPTACRYLLKLCSVWSTHVPGALFSQISHIERLLFQWWR